MSNADSSTEWALTPTEYALVMTKNRGNRLGFAPPTPARDATMAMVRTPANELPPETN